MRAPWGCLMALMPPMTGGIMGADDAPHVIFVLGKKNYAFDWKDNFCS